MNMATNPVFMARSYRMKWLGKETTAKALTNPLARSIVQVHGNTLGEVSHLRHASPLSREKILPSEYRSARTFSGWRTPKICPRRLIQILLRFFVRAEYVRFPLPKVI